MQKLKRSVWTRLLELLAPRIPLGIHSQRVIVEFIAPELQRHGFLQEKGRGCFDRIMRLGWWIIVVIVLFVPNGSGRASFYFPAIFGATLAWLLAMPALAQAIVSGTDFTAARPSPTLLPRMIQRLRELTKDVPAELEDDDEVAKEGAEIAHNLPIIAPSVLLMMLQRFAMRIAWTGFVAFVGMLAGGWLSSIRLNWLPGFLRGWSPVAVLYALSAPGVVIILVSMAAVIFIYSYLASKRAEAQLGLAEKQPEDLRPESGQESLERPHEADSESHDENPDSHGEPRS